MLILRMSWKEKCEFTSKICVHVDLTSDTVVVPSLVQDTKNNMTAVIMGTSTKKCLARHPVKFEEKGHSNNWPHCKGKKE